MEIKVTGHKDIDRALAKFERSTSRKVLRKAMREGFKITAAAARAIAPKGVDRNIRGKPHKAGLMKKSLKVRAAKGERKGDVAVRVAASAKDYVGDAFYAPMVNFGTRKMAPRAFMEQALRETESQAIAKTLASLRSQIESINLKG